MGDLTIFLVVVAMAVAHRNRPHGAAAHVGLRRSSRHRSRGELAHLVRPHDHCVPQRNRPIVEWSVASAHSQDSQSSPGTAAAVGWILTGVDDEDGLARWDSARRRVRPRSSVGDLHPVPRGRHASRWDRRAARADVTDRRVPCGPTVRHGSAGVLRGRRRRRGARQQRSQVADRARSTRCRTARRLRRFIVPVRPQRRSGSLLGGHRGRPRPPCSSSDPIRRRPLSASVSPSGVGVTRVLLGVHWVSDVVAGLLVGWAWWLAVTIAFGGPRAPLRTRRAHPSRRGPRSITTQPTHPPRPLSQKRIPRDRHRRTNRFRTGRHRTLVEVDVAARRRTLDPAHDLPDRRDRGVRSRGRTAHEPVDLRRDRRLRPASRRGPRRRPDRHEDPRWPTGVPSSRTHPSRSPPRS